jgi:hypothetical protein
VEGSPDAGDVLQVSSAKSDGAVVMAAASTTSSAQDWAPVGEGVVSNAVTAGVLSSRLDMLYGGDSLVEYQYAPDGVPSDLCLSGGYTVGLDGAIVPAATVVLGQCGYSASTMWIIDGTNEADGYVDLINAGYTAAWSEPGASGSYAASAAAFAEPLVLTVNSSGAAVLAPLSDVGSVSPTQMWGSWSSTAQSELRTKVAAEAAAASSSS